MTQLHLGDCLEFMRTLPAGSVDAVVTDPPYGIGFPYNLYQDTRENLAALIDAFMPEAMRVARRVIVLPGITQVNLYPPADWIGCITWNTTGSFGKYGFTQWMPALCYGKDLSGFGNVNGVTKTDTLRISGGGGVGFQRSAEEKLHTCPKPLNLMELVVNRFVEIGATVFDPFMGSGTTGVACVQTGRRFIGCEIDANYFAIAQRRIEAAQQQPALIGVTA